MNNDRIFRVQGMTKASAQKAREAMKNPRTPAERTAIKVGIMHATVYPATGAVLLKMDTGNSVALTHEEAMALCNLLVEHLPTKKDEEPNAN